MSGFTLIECLISILVAIILACIAIPSVTYLNESSKLETLSISLMKEMVQTRNLAVNYAETITICLSEASGYCSINSMNRLISFVDINKNQRHEANEENIFSDNINNTSKLSIRSNRLAYIFQPDGTVAGTPGTIRICSEYTHQGMEIVTAMSGRVRMQKTECPAEP